MISEKKPARLAPFQPIAQHFRLKDLLLFVLRCHSRQRMATSFVVFYMLFGFCTHAQRTDTAAGPFYTDKNSWQYKMETGAERWYRGKKAEDFQVFEKFRFSEKGVSNVSFQGKASLYWLNNVEEMELAAAGITRQNADSFIYHVTLNDSVELVPWTKPQEFRSTNGLEYAYLGKFEAHHKLIKLEIYKLGKYYDRSVSIFNSLYLPEAALRAVVVNQNSPYLFRPYMQHYIPHQKQLWFAKKGWEKEEVEFQWTDSINHLAVEIEPTIQNDLYNVYLKRTIRGRTDTAYVSNVWEVSHYSPNPFLRINSSFFKQPGNYEIIVVPEAPAELKQNSFSRAVSVPFTVMPSDVTMLSMQQALLGLGAVLLVGFLLFAYIQKRNKSRLSQASQQQEIARLQLTSVRAQLNPHFMYNAMAGIQNLINKNEVSAANVYLSRFARITRSVLDEGKTEFVSIAEEIKFLHDYLGMEQMRFGFQYSIDLDDRLDDVNTEIPAMLVQPFVENAVKHGITSAGDDGKITISLQREEQNLLVTIHDNGAGFHPSKQGSGRGLELSKKRVQFFNSFHKETPILLNIRSDANGTVVSITLKNWL